MGVMPVYAQSAAVAGSSSSPGSPGPVVTRTVLTIGETSYDGNARAAMGFVGIDSLVLATEGADSLAFSVAGCGPDLPFIPGLPVTFSTVDDQGNTTLRFTGDLQRPQANPPSGSGWTFRYNCTDLKARADNVPVTGLDGSGTAQFNLPPGDPAYLSSLAGLTVGQIVQLVLQVPDVAAGLTEVGVGQITSSSSGSTIPASTQNDLAALTIVPNRPIQINGMGVLGQLESFIRDWHPQYSTYLEPDGTIRVRSPFTFPAQAITLPSDTAIGDPVDGLAYEVDVADCFTAYQVTGLDVDLYVGSIRNKTMFRASDPNVVAVWTIKDFLQPKGSADNGTASNVTSTSVTVHSDDPTAHWTENYLPSVQAQISLTSSIVQGLARTSQTRAITSCTALSPGGTATITWDESEPIANASFDRYRIVAINTPLAEVGRLMGIGNNSDPNNPINRGTFAGSHMFAKAPRAIPWANNSISLGVQYPTAIVQWSADRSGNAPYYELPVSVTLLPDQGMVLLDQPDAAISAPYSTVETHYPTTEADGAPHDVILLLPINKGQLQARTPASGYSGTAYTKYGIQRTRVIHLDSFLDRGQMSQMLALAAEQLAVYQDAVVTGSIAHVDLPTAFDPFLKGYALDLTIPGCTTPLDGLALPVRSVEFSWPNSGPHLATAKYTFSNQRRPAPNFDRFLHPALANDTFGLQGYDFPLDGGSVGGIGGGLAAFDAPASFSAVDNGSAVDPFAGLVNTGGAIGTGFDPGAAAEIDPFDFGDMGEFRGSKGSGRDASGRRRAGDVNTPFWQDSFQAKNRAKPGISQEEQVAMDQSAHPAPPSTLDAMLAKDRSADTGSVGPQAPRQSIPDGPITVQSAPGTDTTPADLIASTPRPPAPSKPADVVVRSADDGPTNEPDDLLTDAIRRARPAKDFDLDALGLGGMP